MVTYVDGYEVSCLVPTRLAGHIIVDEATVYLESLESDVFHLAFLVVTVDDGHVGSLATIAYITEGDVLDTPTGCGTIFGIVTHLNVE